MTVSKPSVDRRTARTRQTLLRVFKDIVQEKGFAATSIREIAERANINRGTFYLHFADKYMLTEAVVRDAFRHELDRALAGTSGWARHNLYLLIEAVLTCLEGKYRHQPRPIYALAEVAPLVERAMQIELVELLTNWLKGETCAEKYDSAMIERVARVVSWAIFGTALQWSQEELTTSAETIAHTILVVVIEGVAHLVPEALPA